MSKFSLTLGLFILAVAPTFASIIASSDFENAANGVDGWTFINDGSNLQRVASGGNPGGFLQITDTAQGLIMYFVAPAKFLGNVSAAYGGKLTYDLQQSTNAAPFFADNLILIGNGLTLAYDTAVAPALSPAWTSYNVNLLAAAGWRVGNTAGPAATEAQLQSVLSNLTAMEIRAEFSSAVDIDGIDNVILTSPTRLSVSPVPEPRAMSLLLAGLAFLAWKRSWTRQNPN